MTDNQIHKTNNECIDILKFIFNNAEAFFNQIAPKGLKKSDLLFFLHPTPEQQYEEHIRIRENINRLTKKSKQEDRKAKISDFKQDDLSDISEYDEFLYVLGLSVYDIFSNNHEVIGNDNKIYDFGSLRGSGGFIADFFNDNCPDNSKKYNYIDFYMGTIWIKERGDLTPIYEYIFRKLKDYRCDWKYSFPRMYLIGIQKSFDPSDEDNLKNYNPETAVQKELELTEKDKQTKKFQEELNKIYKEEYENAKYKPLCPMVQAYKNIYGQLPNGHPQKEFE